MERLEIILGCFQKITEETFTKQTNKCKSKRTIEQKQLFTTPPGAPVWKVPILCWHQIRLLSKVIFLIEPGQSRVTRVHEGVFCSNNPSRLLQTLADSAKDNQPKKLSIQCISFQLLKIWMKHLYTNWNSSTLICVKGGCKNGWVSGGRLNSKLLQQGTLLWPPPFYFTSKCPKFNLHISIYHSWWEIYRCLNQVWMCRGRCPSYIL